MQAKVEVGVLPTGYAMQLDEMFAAAGTASQAGRQGTPKVVLVAQAERVKTVRRPQAQGVTP